MLTKMLGESFYSRQPRDGASRVVRIKHGKFFQYRDQEFFGLLLVQADSKSIETTYEHLSKGVARPVPMEPGEGARTEAHVVIRLTHTLNGTSQSYPVALEESPGLSPSVLLSRLHHPFHKAGAREGKDPSGEIRKWYPIVSLDGLFSRSLLDEIERGRLNSFELVRQTVESTGIDEPGELVPTRQTLHVSLRPAREEGFVIRSIAAARRLAFEESYDQVRISYKEANSAKNKTAVIDVDEDSPDPASELDKLVSRSCVVSLPSPMNWDHEVVVDEFLELMAEKLIDEVTED